jgi:hypothetical protein
VVSLRLEDVPGSEEEGEGVGVELRLLLVVDDGGGTLLVLDCSTVEELLVGGVTVVEVVVSLDDSDVCVGVWLALVVVELVSSRFASCKMEVARAGFALWTASIALCSDSNTPSRNRPGRYR